MENTYSQLTDSGIKEFDIIILGLGENSYKLLKGEEYLNNMLSANGEFPKPVGFIDFQTVCDAKLFFGIRLSGLSACVFAKEYLPGPNCNGG